MALLTKSARTLYNVEGCELRLHTNDQDKSPDIEGDFRAAAVANGVPFEDKPAQPVGLNSALPKWSIRIWVPGAFEAGFERELACKHTILPTE